MRFTIEKPGKDRKEPAPCALCPADVLPAQRLAVLADGRWAHVVCAKKAR